MNLHFNIAIHALTFLMKHEGEYFSSEDLARLICINPVQLRKVMMILVQEGYVISKKGKLGGYTIANASILIKLSSLYELFRKTGLDMRVVTGDEHSDCLIAKNIGQLIFNFYDNEHQQLQRFYSQITIQDILKNIVGKEVDNEKI